VFVIDFKLLISLAASLMVRVAVASDRWICYLLQASQEELSKTCPL
jgi:hypothetical protein